MSDPGAPHGKGKQLVHFVDLDGTLAYWDGTVGNPPGSHIGEPVPAMADKVRAWLAAGDRVVIYTARACNWGDFPWADPGPDQIRDYSAAVRYVEDWAEKYFGQRLEVCGGKGPWDHAYNDKTYRVVTNTGMTVEELVLDRIRKHKGSLFKGASAVEIVLSDLEEFILGL